MLLILLACTDPGADDSALLLPCQGGYTPSVAIGTGIGGEFQALESGQTVGLIKAPQGGFGVPVRLRTEGLRVWSGEELKAPMQALLETRLDGEESASFLNDSTVGYCQDEGWGLVVDLVVGFDKDAYNQNNLVLLHGKVAELYVQAIDADGLQAENSVDVILSVE